MKPLPLRAAALGALFIAGTLAAPAAGEKEPRRVAADPVREAIRIDGVLDEKTWTTLMADETRAASGWFSIPHPGKPSFDRRAAFFAWDKEFLYVALKVEPGDEATLAAPEFTGDDTVRIDLKGAALGIARSGEQIQSIMLPFLIPIRAAARETEEGWVAEMAIPWAQLDVTPQAGEAIVFNIAGSDLSGDISWAPARDHRDVKAFGRLELR